MGTLNSYVLLRLRVPVSWLPLPTSGVHQSQGVWCALEAGSCDQLLFPATVLYWSPWLQYAPHLGEVADEPPSLQVTGRVKDSTVPLQLGALSTDLGSQLQRHTMLATCWCKRSLCQKSDARSHNSASYHVHVAWQWVWLWGPCIISHHTFIAHLPGAFKTNSEKSLRCHPALSSA